MLVSVPSPSFKFFGPDGVTCIAIELFWRIGARFLAAAGYLFFADMLRVPACGLLVFGLLALACSLFSLFGLLASCVWAPCVWASCVGLVALVLLAFGSDRSMR